MCAPELLPVALRAAMRTGDATLFDTMLLKLKETDDALVRGSLRAAHLQAPFRLARWRSARHVIETPPPARACSNEWQRLSHLHGETEGYFGRPTFQASLPWLARKYCSVEVRGRPSKAHGRTNDGCVCNGSKADLRWQR